MYNVNKVYSILLESCKRVEESIAGLFEASGAVEELEFTLEFLAHIEERATYDKHRISSSEILEAHHNNPRYFTNRAGLRAPTIMVGKSARGRIITVPLEPSGTYSLWRPVTAFEANQHDIQRFQEET